MTRRLTEISPYILSMVRIVVGLMFLHHGADKVFGLFSGKPAEGGLVWVAGWLELVGGGLIVAGLMTRFTAFALCGEMAVAYFMAHAPHGTWPIQNKGELAVLYCFFFLYLTFAGGGPLALDSLFRRKRDRDLTIPLDEAALASV